MPKLRLEPEQEAQLIRELEELGPLIERTLGEFQEMRGQSMDYVQIHGILISALVDGDNFDHIADTFEYFEARGCHHFGQQLFALLDIFFMLGRNIERTGTSVSPTFTLPAQEEEHGSH